MPSPYDSFDTYDSGTYDDLPTRSNPKGLILEITDHDWNRLTLTRNVVANSLSITEVLGEAEGEGSVTVPLDDHSVEYIPDPESNESIIRRFKVYDDEGNLEFAGSIDTVSKSSEGVTIKGKQRGIELARKFIGRRDFLAWNIRDLARELTRDNIGRAPYATVTATNAKTATPAVNVITGQLRKGVYWAPPYTGSKPFAISPPEALTIDLGSVKTVDAVRVVPEWWLKNGYTWNLYTSVNGTAYTLQYAQGSSFPYTDRGILVELDEVQCRYVKVSFTGASDGYARCAGIFVYQNVAEIGDDTNYAVPWIENDSSGNITTVSTSRVVQNGAWNGEDLDTSFVTKLNTGGTVEHRFRGDSNSVYFTQDASATAAIYVDDVLQETITIPPFSYQYKGYEITGLAAGSHTLKVSRSSGNPQVDYFTGSYESSYRIAQEDNPSAAYTGSWKRAFDDNLSGRAKMLNTAPGSFMLFDFYGDSVEYYGAKSTSLGIYQFYIDGVSQGTEDAYNSTALFQQLIFTWNGSYGPHQLKVVNTGTKNASSTGFGMDVDYLAGNWAHVLYLRADRSSNLSMLQSLTEMTNSFMRLNYDGTIDILGSVGDDTGTIIREGENEGGTITSTSIEGDYTEMVSAIVAVGKGSDNHALEVHVRDQNAVNAIGIQVGKLQSSDSTDAYLLVREAWQTLQENKIQKRRYNVEYEDELIVLDGEEIQVVPEPSVGDMVRLYKPTLGLLGESYRVFRKIIGHTDSGRTISLDVANKRDNLGKIINRSGKQLSEFQNTPQGHLNVAQYGGSSDNFVAETGGSTFRSSELDFYVDDNAQVLEAKLHVKIGKYRTYERDTTSGGGSTSGASSAASSASGGSSSPTSASAADHNHLVAAFVSNIAGAATDRLFQFRDGGGTLVGANIATDTPSAGVFTHSSDGSHSHSVTIGSHSHTIAHTHQTNDHVHQQTYDIHEEGSYPGAVSVILDGVNINSLVGGPFTASATSETFDADLGDVLTSAGWHTLRLEAASGKGRCTPYVIVKSLQLQ